MPVIDLDGLTLSYRVRTSKRAKRISLRYSMSAGLEVVYPAGLRQPEPESLLRERSAWVRKAIARFRDANANRRLREYRAGEEFLFRGVSYRLKLERAPSLKRIKVGLADGHLVAASPKATPPAADAEIRAAIESFYRAQAQRYLPQRVEELARRHGFKYERVRIKNQKTRWGSCSAKGNINLNLRLMMAPDGAIDYVITHELCHLRELNHNPAFWALVETYCPEFRHWKAWFKQHGPSLIL